MNPTMNNNRSSLSSQRADLEAACKEEHSPPTAHSPQSTNRRMLDQKLSDDKKIKIEVDDDKNESNDKIKSEDSEDHKTGSKWMKPGDIKSEKRDADGQQLDMNTNVIGRDNWNQSKEHDIKQESKIDAMDVKIKSEPMSPPSSSDNQALVKAELKLEPVPNADQENKKCSKYSNEKFAAASRESIHDFLSSSLPSVFKPEELCEALLPTLDMLKHQDPESIPFRAPVDPITLGIPDYLDIVKKPMDLGTIENKLRKGKYSDPWEYVNDVWLMFDNAWLYNRNTSRVYRYCTKVRVSCECSPSPCDVTKNPFSLS